MLLFSLLFACAEETAISYATGACENWDLDSEDPPVLLGESTGTGLFIARNGIRRDCAAQFKPEVEIDRKVIRVFEGWEAEGDGSCEACLMATLDVDPLPGRSYEIQWYDESSDTDPVDTLSVSLK